ncbi:uncharacterized protein EDB91DRAFT_1255616 [Suillus paluster]|uniref:uncharacterized protein n=1 Tax=Suillus paluster TaxID=48578 RepID=UPI001B87E2BC|nr:uncharacterized protein EDB91DRAFT_1255616 [Suillus paluster]KAG1723465.1 hypothetical protein EDB91DRAFT_1255616 [Suillus paluster]
MLGENHDHIFPVDIRDTQTVGDLKDLIKEKKKPEFDDIAAHRLQLQQVNLPVDETLKDCLDNLTPEQFLPSVTQLSNLFDDRHIKERLHIVVQVQKPPEPAGSSRPLHLKLNCLVLREHRNNIFSVYIRDTENVADLKYLIKEKKRPEFDDIAAHRLKLQQKVNLPVNETLKYCLDNLTPEQFLSPVTKLLKVFKYRPDEEHLHIVVQSPHTVPVVPQISVVGRRLTYLQKSTGPPSAGAKLATFSATQEKEEYLCNRPRRAADSLPVTLLERIFAEFVDDCQNYQPTAYDNDFVLQLSENMSSFYPDELTRMNVFRQFVQVIIEGKNEIGSGGAEPFAEAMLHYRKFMENSQIEIVRLRSVIPCIHIIVFGACIGFAGSVFIEKVQLMAARTFGALKIATEKLGKLYSQPIPLLEDEDASLGCPYPRDYTHSGDHIQQFSYDETQSLRDRLIFFGKTVGDVAGSGRKICIKFVRHYSREAHDFCAGKGHAPKLIAYNTLAGGWNMVVMDVLDIDDGRSAQRPSSYRSLSAMAVLDRQPLKEAISSLIKKLHADGYVHGDLRDMNFVVRDNNKDFMLLDFNWAGLTEKAHYPMYVNRKDI